MQTFGDRLNERVYSARTTLFLQGEIAQLTYQSFDKYAQLIRELPDNEIDQIRFDVQDTNSQGWIHQLNQFDQILATENAVAFLQQLVEDIAPSESERLEEILADD